MESLSYSKNFYIASYHTNNKGEASLQTILQFFQEIAWEHAEAMDLGFSDLQKKDLIWVLAREKLKIYRFPVWQDKIVIKTIASGKDKYFWFRDFYIYGDNNEELVKANSSWIIISMKTRRPYRNEDLYMLDSDTSKMNDFERPLRLPSVLSKEVKYDKTITYSDIDLNNHVNNAKYIEWILDSYPIDFLKDHLINSVELNYNSEAFFGEKIFVYKDIDGLTHTHSIRNSENKEVFKSRIIWK